MSEQRTASLIKILLWVLGVLIALLTVIQLLLTPQVLTPFIKKYAEYYIDADVRFEKVSINVFRYFPNLSLTIDSCMISYSSDRFADCIDRDGLMKASLFGCSRDTSVSHTDTLAVMNEFRVSINPFSLLTHKLRIKNISITDLKGFLHRYDSTRTNWDILKNIVQEEDTTTTEDSFKLPVPIIGKVSLDGQLGIIFSDEVTESILFSRFHSLEFKGNRDSDKSLLRDFSLKLDSLFVFGSHSKDSIAVTMDKLRIMSVGASSVAGELDTRLFMLSSRYGRIRFPADIAFTADIPSETMDSIRLTRFDGHLCGLPFSFGGEFACSGDSLWVDAALDVRNGPIGDIAEEYGVPFIEQLKQIHTDATTDIHFQAKGFYSKKSSTLPGFKMNMTIPESYVFIGDSDTARFFMECHADNLSRGRADFVLDTISVFALKSTRINLSGGLKDFLGKDPLIDINMSVSSLLTDLSDKFGTDSTFRATGTVEGMVKGTARISQLKLPDIWNADINAGFQASDVNFTMPADSISICSDSIKCFFGAGANQFFPDLKQGKRIISAGASIDTALIRIKDDAEISVNDLKIKCLNDATLSGSDKGRQDRIPQLFADITAGRLSLMDSDSSRITLRGTRNTLKLISKENQDTIPAISLSSSNRFFLLLGREGRVSVTGFNINFYAEKRSHLPSRPKQFTGLTNHNEREADDFSSSDINFSLGESFKSFYKEWNSSGQASFTNARVATPLFPLKNTFSDFSLSFHDNSLALNSLTISSGNTRAQIHGELSGLRKALLRGGTAQAEFSLNSEKLDINELIAAMALGSTSKPSAIISEDDSPEIPAEQILSSAENLKSPLIVIPGNLKAKVDINGHNISASNIVIDSLSTRIEMQDRCLKVSHISATTNVGEMSFEGFYATKSKKDISLGINLGLSRVTAAEVIDMLPDIDTIMPMLQSFDGKLNCYMAGMAGMDTNMNILPHTITGVIRIEGDSLRLEQDPEVKKIARLLMFKNKNDFNVKSMSVEAQINDNRIEVFPFLLKIDRYTIAASGMQNLDQSCRYHLSVIKSPLPFRIGLDIYGDDFDKLHYKLVKPKYKSEEKIPVFSSTIDDTRLNLSHIISNIFSIGIDKVGKDSVILDYIEKRKHDISYTDVQNSVSEELSEEEIKQMENEAENNNE